MIAGLLSAHGDECRIAATAERARACGVMVREGIGNAHTHAHRRKDLEDCHQSRVDSRSPRNEE